MVKTKKEIIIYPKKSFGGEGKKYRDNLDYFYKFGSITPFTYKRLINQYYNSYI
jgi:hypothetical protein